ncbi:hypothetical protein ACHHYP_10002 [Achlya hypogyna]|uniref:Fibronectin type-III domain-containing protein n=1 Tax=Achlya hypogyna TaxID=1202772 RepID=A0A1V9YM09_ACHHY|nr:hypothetical protein ACHHYP_10002 [Achlya hypogyna]
MSRHRELVEKRLAERFRLTDALLESDEQREINDMIQRVAKLAAEDDLREDGFCFSDGQYLGSRRYKETPGMVLRVLQGHIKPVRGIAFVPAGIVTFGMDGVFAWDMESTEPVLKVDRSIVGDNACRITGAISPAGTDVMCCAGDAPVRLALRQGDAGWSLDVQCRGGFGHDGAIMCCCYSPNGAVFVTGSLDTTVIVWNPVDLKVLHVLQAHVGGVATCAFAPTSDFLLTTGTLDGTIKRWDLSFWTLGIDPEEAPPPTLSEPLSILKEAPQTTEDVLSTARSTGSAAGKSMSRRQHGASQPGMASSGNTNHSLEPPTQSLGESCKKDLSRTAESLYSRLEDDCESSMPPSRDLLSPPTTIWSFPNDTNMPRATAGWSSRQKYDRALDALFSPVVTLETLTLANHVPAFASNDDWCFHRPSATLQLPPLYPFEAEDGTIGVREDDDDPNQLEKLETINILRLLDPATAASHPDAEAVAIDEGAHRVPVLEFEHITGDGQYVQHSHTIHAVAFAPSGTFVISASADRSIKVCHDDTSPTGHLEVQRWNAITGCHERTTRDAHTHSILCCALAQHPNEIDVVFLASAGSDSFVKIWNVETMEVLYTLRGHYDSVVSVVFDSGGHVLYSTAQDTRALKWQIVPMVPDPPKQPTIIKADCHSIDIAWTAPLGNGAPVLKYRILMSRDHGPFEAAIEVPPDETKHFMGGLDPGIVHAFKVAAINDVGIGDYSVSSIPTATLAYRPSKIKKPCSVSHVLTRSVVLEWLPPLANGSPITHYHFRCAPEDAFGNDTTITVVVPIEDIHGQNQAERDAIAAGASGRPSKVSRVAAEVVRKAQERADRQAAKAQILRSAKSLERSRKLQLQARARLEKLQRQQELAVPVATVKYTLHCVQPGTIYQFQAAAQNRCGIADFSVPSMYIKTASCEPDAPTQPTISHITPYSVQLNWVKPRTNGSEVVHYTIVYEHNGATTTTVVLARSLAATAYTLSPLLAGKTIRARLSATNVIDKKVHDSPVSEWSDEATTLPTVPSAAAQPILMNPTSHSLTFSFSAPNANGLPIRSYLATLFLEDTAFGVVSHRFVRQFEWHDLGEGPDFAVPVLELTAATAYVMSVAAENALGKGDYSPLSASVRTKTAVVPAALLQAPVLSDVQPTSAVLHWTRPVHNGGSALVGYNVQYSTPGSDVVNLRFPRLDLQMRLDFLKPKTSYTFAVAGINGIGSAAYSLPSVTLTTPSLVEYTVRVYFANRPKEEHDAAARVQVCYRRWRARVALRSAYHGYLQTWLAAWNLL